MSKLTKEQVLAWKIKNDTKFYMENFLKIRDKNSQLIPFKLNTAQQAFEKIIEETEKAGKLHRYIVLKARQLGISTYSTGRMFAKTATHENINTLIIAHEDKATLNLFNMNKLYYDELPSAIRPMKKYSNERALVFENPTNDEEEKALNPGLRSKFTIATAGTTETARSGTYHNVHVSELAFFPNPEKTMTALLQCVPDKPNTLVVIESTANGVGGYFYDMWLAAVEGKSDFIPVFLPWFIDKEYSTPFPDSKTAKDFKAAVNYKYKGTNGEYIYTEEYILKKMHKLTWEQLYWRDRTIANKCGGDIDLFKQEYPSTPEEAFIASGRPRFDHKALKQLELATSAPIAVGGLSRKGETVSFYEDKNGYVYIFKYPVPDANYTIGADVAEGLITGDYSVGAVLDEQCDLVCAWYGHIDPDLFGKELANLGWYYNEAYVAVEGNNHGLTTIRSLIGEEYYNLYNTKIYDKINDEMTTKIGWYTNVKTKPLMINKLAEFIRELLIKIPFDLFIKEMYTYVIDEKGRTNAQIGCHDDTVMALAIALQAYLEFRGEDFVPEKTDYIDDYVQKKKKNFDVIEIIDSLFEDEESKVECS